VPLLLNLDNLKAAVLKAHWFDPEINPKLADFCRHYGLHVMPCDGRHAAARFVRIAKHIDREDVRPGTGSRIDIALAGAVLQLCSHPVEGWQNARPGIFGLWSIQVATI
jgi:hypothetical protein